jgi:type IV secretion system protein VirD4
MPVAAMIGEVRAVGGALVNLSRFVIQRPMSSLVSVLLCPFTAGPYLVKMLALLLVLTVFMVVPQLFIPKDAPHLIFQLINGLGLCVLLFVSFRLLTQPLLIHFGDRDAGTHGTARWATDKEMSALTHDSGGPGLLIGRQNKTNRLLRYQGAAHLLTMAPTRSGKGVGTIIPNLLTARRSVLCIDPKGENAMITAKRRRSFGDVHVLDPFGITGLASSAYNPLDRLDPDSLDIAEEAASLADALVYDEPGQGGEAHWNEEAKALIGGLILTIIATEPEDRRNLNTLREFLTLAPDDFLGLLERMQTTRACNGLIARAANRHMAKSDREAAGVLSSAQRHTHFLDSPRMAAVLAKSDFEFGDLKRGIATVFLVLPPDRLNTYARWLRLLITQSLSDMARTPTAIIGVT